ncbi:MAG TPA: caspase family protein [Spirochaetia bacterium]|nr:caspase family protein [Spirochaetia bacterium]
MKAAILAASASAALLLASCSLTLWDYTGVTTRKYALVYGVTRYSMAASAGSYPNLNYPDSDAQAVAQMLRLQGYQVALRYVDAAGDEWLSTTPSAAVKTDTLSSDPTGANGPSKAKILPDLLSYFTPVVGKDDLFLFYFSGHGMQDTTVSPAMEYFVPEGGVDSAFQGVTSLSVSDAELGGMLSAVSTKRKIVILDTCNSGGFVGNSLEADSFPPASSGMSGSISVQTLIQALSNYLNFPSSASGLSPYGGAMVLSAAGRDEACYESPAPPPYPPGPLLYHGVMTYYLLRAPQSGDLNTDGRVTAGEAFSLVKAGIESEWNAQMPGSSFEPRISGGPVDLVLW